MVETLKFDLNKSFGSFKILNATNGGPWHKRHASDQQRSNLADYAAAKMPYSRNHDSAVCGVYGGPYSHDITCIFPDFSADPYKPESYDFACTDEAILICLEAGTKTFFRLGQTIEHQVKKHGTVPPADFQKWAVICEHIIMHYTEGWADGFELDMPYWEIWNEADLDGDNSANKRTWGGTKAEYFEFYITASKHLKARFPHLKIGGPALAGREDWAEDFLKEVKAQNAPLDFFSWHIYTTKPADVINKAEKMKSLLIKNGFENTESILNEWNYIEGWEDEYIPSLKAIHGLKGAAFSLAVICESQKSSIDMLMYYDTRPSVFNGMFDFYTYEKLKGYYPFYWYGMFYDMAEEVRPVNGIDNIHCLCGKDKNGKILCTAVYYADGDTAGNKAVSFDFGKAGKYEIYALDGEHDAELVKTTDKAEFDFTPYSAVLIKEI